MPVLYRGIVERRIVRLCGELKLIETEMEERAPGADTTNLERRASELEHAASQLRVPLSFSRWLYTLRQHIGLVRGRLRHG